MDDTLDLDELRRLVAISPPREIRQTGSSVYAVDEQAYKRWKAARARLADAVPSLLFRVTQLEAELTGAKIFWKAAHEHAETAESALTVAVARSEQQQDTLTKILQWCDAYPASVFTDQDLGRANAVLAEAGISMTAMHGQWGRQIMAGIGEIARAALTREASSDG